jgi:hypothetical protein
MDEFIEGIYLNELLVQCQYAVDAVKRMNEILASRGGPSEFFREAGDFLQHSSAVSRLLWPPGSTNRANKKRAKRRGAHLRQALKVDDGHVLRNRTLRDHFEHLDERLDDWAETSPNKNIVDNMIGPRAAIGGDAIKDQDIIRMFDPTTKLIVFRGERFDIQGLVNGLTEVQSKAAERVAQLEANRRLQATRMKPRAPEPERYV